MKSGGGSRRKRKPRNDDQRQRTRRTAPISRGAPRRAASAAKARLFRAESEDRQPDGGHPGNDRPTPTPTTAANPRTAVAAAHRAEQRPREGHSRHPARNDSTNKEAETPQAAPQAAEDGEPRKGGLAPADPYGGCRFKIRGSGHRAPTTAGWAPQWETVTRAPTTLPGSPCYRAAARAGRFCDCSPASARIGRRTQQPDNQGTAAVTAASRAKAVCAYAPAH